ncbi:MAG TPA: hypothetical protein PLB79_00195 [Thermotogota bacterium]|nr:hypothetical protein [Thermotogaceae bacterium]OQC30576.1 MAG: hypothetical protein BWX67_01702 [Thermotogota bacterium ADurb.Bin062]HNW47079.1 hypothetical protein [Thermotogota bacterium]HOD91875.1 hypothetical protein [Thermotogota bacterium]HOF24341.1 hypothetical protein [Thermotogota bacterium]
MRVFAYDVQSIHSFLFESLEFKAIAGASRLIDKFDESMKLNSSESCECLFAGGGNGLFIIKHRSDSLQQAFEKNKAQFLFDHPVVSVEFEIEDWPPKTTPFPPWFQCKGLENSGDFPKIYSRVALELEKQKQRVTCQLTSPKTLRNLCPLCGNREIDSNSRYNDDLICEVCSGKIEEAKSIEDKKVTFNLEEISRSLTKKGEREEGYLGVIYGDGNSLGNVYQKMNTPMEFSELSALLRREILGAIQEATKSLTRYAVPLLGGDDFLMIVPPERVFYVLHALEKKLSRLQAERKITFSFGLAVLPTTIPLKFIFQIVEDLQDEAKKANKSDPKAHGEHCAAFRYLDTPFFGAMGGAEGKIQYGVGMSTFQLWSLFETARKMRKQEVTKGVFSKLEQLFLKSGSKAFTLNGFYYLMRNTKMPPSEIRELMSGIITNQNFGTITDLFLYEEGFGEGRVYE